MSLRTHSLHILFFPFMAPGHMNPMINMVKLFASRGVKTTILTTPSNASLIQPNIDNANYPITIVVVPFPCAEVGLPEECESFPSIPSPELQPNFLRAVAMLRQPFDQILTELVPDCVITDIFLPWTCSIAAAHGVPRLEFSGMSFFALCAGDSLVRHKPLESLPPAETSFVLPGLPHRIEMLRAQIPDITQFDPAILEVFIQAKEAESQSYGFVVNSFYELESDYVEHYRKVVGQKAWHVGPLSLSNRPDEVDIDSERYLRWLDSKAPGSVVYACFGSACEFTAAQLREMAIGFGSADHPFIWVVRDHNNNNNQESWMPEGYEERIHGRGLLIRGWVPQVLILNHPAIGGFVTHCGWNSSLEAVITGVPLLTWPLIADQFYNERLIIDVMGIGVSIGIEEYVVRNEDRVVVEAAEIERMLDELMGSGETAESRRSRARALREKARRALQDGGSSYVEVGNLIEELMCERVVTSETANPIAS